MGRATLFIGTSGFAFDGWVGPFYPEGTKPKAMLGHYASRLSSVEINYTFRRFPSEATLAGWIAQTPETFTFTVKAHMRITHTKRLGDPEPATSFIERVRGLGPRLGPVLFQCPPNLKVDGGRLAAFVAALPPGPRYAFEFRHPSWAAEKEALLGRGCAFVVSETDEEPTPDAPLDAGRFVYLRLRKEAYGPAELDAWARRIGETLAGGTEVFCYLKHEDDGAGPRLAEALRERVAAVAAAP
jgi:uncharacterized protein YecE (DUF72 family)